MKTIINPQRDKWTTILERPTQTVEDIENTVNQIFQDVKQNGDFAISKYTSMFDDIELENNIVSQSEINEAKSNVSKELKVAINQAKQNIETFHKAQKISNKVIETSKGVWCWQEKRPIEKIGLYIPGGTAPLFSTVLMLAVPAQIAGCKDIVICSPPNKEGKIANEILYAAQLCGVTKIIKVGGIQAVAGLTFGTDTIPKVYKIFGPGNQFVTVAKQLSTKYGIAIDMPAGPSELLVVADDSAKAAYVASDLLSQAEHGSDSQVILVSTSKEMIIDVENEVEKQLKVLPRKDIAKKAINNSKLIYVENDAIALDLINEYGPEHFIICTKDNDFYINGICNAGSVFIGNYTPESAGDYASGTNHTLPTNGFSKAYSGVNLDSFTKSITFQKISEEGLLNIGETIELMAAAERLEAHKNAVTIRLKDLIPAKSGISKSKIRNQMDRESFNINNLIRDNIKSLKPYSSARDEYKDASEDMVFLDANENPFNNGVNRYPDPQQNGVKDALAEQKGIAKANILLGNGSDEVLDLIFRAFCEPNRDKIITLPPTYGMYNVLAKMNAVENIKIELEPGFQPNIDEILRAAHSQTKLLFLCSPNNPSGNSFKIEDVEKLLLDFNGIVVIDEAYIDFSEQKSWLNRLEEFPNLIVTQTLSKAYGMAGIRLGICYASKEITAVLNKIKPPYNVNKLTQNKALERLNNPKAIQDEVNRILEERKKLNTALRTILFIKEIYVSDANFVLVKVDDANKRYKELVDKGIVARNRTTQPLCENCLRFTVGSHVENEKLINVLKTLS